MGRSYRNQKYFFSFLGCVGIFRRNQKCQYTLLDFRRNLQLLRLAAEDSSFVVQGKLILNSPLRGCLRSFFLGRLARDLFAQSRYAVGYAGSLFYVLTGFLFLSHSWGFPITFLHTNDLHGHDQPSTVQPYGLGGWARLKTLIDQRRAQLDPQATFLVDAGDRSEGSMSFTLDEGRSALRAMEIMGYDTLVLGNHDFLSGPSDLEEMKSHPWSFSILAANLIDPSTAMAPFPPVAVFQRLIQGVSLKVGIIGLTTFDIMYESYIRPWRIQDPISVATSYAQKLRRENFDVIILLSHNSIELNRNLARSVPFVNAVISGHSHVKLLEPFLEPNADARVPVVETGEWGHFLGQLTLEVHPRTKRVRYQSYQLLPVSAELEKDSQIDQFIHQFYDQLTSFWNRSLEDPVGESHILGATNYRSNQTTFQVLAELYRQATHSLVGIEMAKFVEQGFLPGHMSLLDCFQVVPHFFNAQSRKTWRLLQLPLSGTQLTRLLELWLQARGVFHSLGQMHLSGAEIIYEPRSAVKIRNIFIHHRPVTPQGVYTLGIHDGLLRSLEVMNDLLQLQLPLDRVIYTDIEPWQALLSQAQSRSGIVYPSWQEHYGFRTLGYDLGLDQVEALPSALQGDLSLRVKITNFGLQTAPSTAHFSVFRGAANDPVQEGTSSEELTQLTGFSLPGILPGHSYEFIVNIPRNQISEQGVIPIVLYTNGGDGQEQDVSNNGYRYYNRRH